ncbi:MAG: lysophospholipid acyltransferase family protein [Desulfobacterota bacterium]|nr:lysophospholipid acyltransferase family protein [Thermodesulfobacteriota bacterium]
MFAYPAYLLLKALGFIVNRLPDGIALWIGRRLGDLMYLVDFEHRRVALRNLEIAFGEEKTREERRAIARKNFQNLGMMAIEFFQIPKMDLKRYQERVTVEGLEGALKILEEGKGALLLLGHFGNWELMAPMARMIERPILAIAKPIKRNPWLNRWIIESRQKVGLRIIPPVNATPKVIRALSENIPVAILFDQRGKRSQGVWADFFGRKVPTTAGLAVMALRSGAPVLPVFMIREGGGRHRLIIKDPLPLIQTGHFRKDVEANTQLFNQVLESIIRQYPEQWLWIHRRFERKPKRR